LFLSDIKQDIKLLETLLIGLIEPLNTEKGRIIVMEMLHQVYFAPIKSYLIVLLRSVLQLHLSVYLQAVIRTPYLLTINLLSPISMTLYNHIYKLYCVVFVEFLFEF